MQTIPIFYTYDNNYVIPSAVAFESLLDNAKENIFYKMYVLHTDISQENQQKLIELVSKHKNATLEFINIEELAKNIKISDKAFTHQQHGTIFTKDCFFRCIPSLIPEFDCYDKIIYSDVDIVVVDDISESFDIDLKDEYLASFRVPYFLKEEISHLDSSFVGKYFGGGFWVMNLKKMREDNLGKEIIDIITNPPCQFRWNDQDVMNLACKGQVKYLSYRYVSIPDWLPILEKLDFYDKHYPNNELHDAMYKPKIVHYAGCKPWNKDKPMRSDLWYYYLTKTCFKESYNLNDFKTTTQSTYKCYFAGIVPLPEWFLCLEKHNKKYKLRFLKNFSILKMKEKK